MTDEPWQGVYLRRGTNPSHWVPLRGIYRGLTCAICGEKRPTMYRIEPDGDDLCFDHREPAEENPGEENPHGR